MATYYPGLSNQRDVLPAPYLRDQKLSPGPEPTHLPVNMMYLNQASSGSYAELLSGVSLSSDDSAQVPPVGTREELEFIPPTGDHVARGVSVDNTVNEDSQIDSRASIHVADSEQSLRCQGLLLSLGTQIPSSGHAPLFHYQYTDPGTSSLLSSHFQAEDGSRSKESCNAEYYNLTEGTHDTVKFGPLNNPYCVVGPNEMHSSLHLYEPSGLVSTIYNSKYLKAVQQLLDEVVNVQKALKHSVKDKHSNSNKSDFYGSKEMDMKVNGNSSDAHESTAKCSLELSPSERQDLQNKLTKLSSMLDEVDRRYRQYHHQMQIVVSSFEMVAGHGAAKPYTALALQTISRHFRCLRDAIDGQMQVTRQSLGEQDATPAGHGALPRLRYVDQQLRQQKALQQFGVMRHSWRPQRGLPENSVSILRAWLFEHFLHPYPKDSEKIMLAKQTGLTRSQVANWFINARVRLWKPMVEDMYKEEFGELDSKSSPDHGSRNANDEPWPSEDMGEKIRESVTPRAAESDHLGEIDDSKPNLIADVGMQGCTARLGFQNSGCGDDYIDCRMMKLQDDQIPNMDDHNLSADGNSITAAAAAYNISELGNFAVNEQVSLALGLQRGEKDSLSISGGMQFRGDYTAVSSADHDYHCMDSLNQQHVMTNPEMLPDFVA